MLFSPLPWQMPLFNNLEAGFEIRILRLLAILHRNTASSVGRASPNPWPTPVLFLRWFGPAPGGALHTGMWTLQSLSRFWKHPHQTLGRLTDWEVHTPWAHLALGGQNQERISLKPSKETQGIPETWEPGTCSRGVHVWVVMSYWTYGLWDQEYSQRRARTVPSKVGRLGGQGRSSACLSLREIC